MAAFSYNHFPFLLDSIYFQDMPTANTKLSSFIMDDGNNFNSDSFSQLHSPHHLVQDPNRRESSCVVSQSDNDSPLGKKQRTGGGDSTAVVDKLENGEKDTRKGSLVRYRKQWTRNATTLNSAKSKVCMRSEKKSSQEPPTGFVHVRARRGQATDSHSLAERVRRKKISERMKILQCLVPGCEKVTGKALMLDEIINYVQSLQNQVEFLSMKLASVSPMFYDFGVDLEALMVKPERVNSEASTTTAVLPCLQPSNPTHASAFVDSTTATFAPSLLLHQGQNPIVFSHPQDTESVLWDVDGQRQKFLNYSWSNNLCSFH